MKVLELFAGHKSISNAFKEAGHEVFTIDANPKLKPDYSTDLLRWDLEGLPWKPDVIWASPPCPCFSVMTLGKNWDIQGRPKTVGAVRSMGLVLATLEIIDKLKPKYYFIENPVGMLRKMSFMQNHNRITVDYCQYGDTLRKSTDLFTNVEGWKGKRCHNGATCHESAPRGAFSGLQGKKHKERAIIPKELAKEIVKICEKGYKTSTQYKL
jgi:site-specific DNA-cytosine methylase